MLREQYPDIFHGYDVWHMAKNLRKKLNKAAKKHPKIGAWNSQFVNHLWWCAENCGKNPELLVEMFHSSLFHVLNIHKWGRRTVIHRQFKNLRGKRPYPTLPVLNKKCWHLNLTNDDARKTKWFKVTEDDFKALFKVITGTMFSNNAANFSTQVRWSHCTAPRSSMCQNPRHIIWKPILWWWCSLC